MSSEFKTFFVDCVKYGIPTILFFGAIYRGWIYLKQQKSNSELLIAQNELAKMELKEKRNRVENENTPIIDANVYRFSQGKYRLKIYNPGMISAYNVDYSYDTSSNLIIHKNCAPFKVLEGGKSFEEIIVYCDGCSGAYEIELSWESELGEIHRKNAYVSI